MNIPDSKLDKLLSRVFQPEDKPTPDAPSQLRQLADAEARAAGETGDIERAKKLREAVRG